MHTKQCHISIMFIPPALPTFPIRLQTQKPTHLRYLPSVLLAQPTISTTAASHLQEIPPPLGPMTPVLGDTAFMICDRRTPHATSTGIFLLLYDRIQSAFPPEMPWVVTKHLSVTVTAVGVHARLYIGFEGEHKKQSKVRTTV